MLNQYRTLLKYINRFKCDFSAGLDLSQSIQLALLDESKKDIRSSLIKIQRCLESGETLIQSLRFFLTNPAWYPFSRMKQCPNQFVMLESLSSYLEEELKSFDILVKNVRYPIVLIGFLTVTSLFGGFVLLPIYIEFLDELNVMIPKALILMDFIRRIFLNPYIIILLILLGSFILFKFVLFLNIYFQRKIFSVHHAQLWWILANMLAHGYSLKMAIQDLKELDLYHQSMLNDFEAHYLSDMAFESAWSKVIKLSPFEKEILKLSEKSASLSQSLFVLSRLSRQQYHQTQLSRIKYVGPILLMLSGLMIIVCIYVFTLPMTVVLESL